jgi:hypothetical protein
VLETRLSRSSLSSVTSALITVFLHDHVFPLVLCRHVFSVGNTATLLMTNVHIDNTVSCLLYLVLFDSGITYSLSFLSCRPETSSREERPSLTTPTASTSPLTTSPSRSRPATVSLDGEAKIELEKGEC